MADGINELKEDLDFNISYHTGPIELNKKYPVYGIITGILYGDEEVFVLELNRNIKVFVKKPNFEQRKMMKQKAMFEPGIFVLEFTTVLDSEDLEDDEHKYTATCETMIFGRQGPKTEVM